MHKSGRDESDNNSREVKLPNDRVAVLLQPHMRILLNCDQSPQKKSAASTHPRVYRDTEGIRA